MDKSVFKMKPYLIGIAGGIYSGKKLLIKEIEYYLKAKSYCVLSLDSYNRELTESEIKYISTYNYQHPSSFDFDLLHQQLIKILNWESINVPIFNKKTGKRESNTIEIKPCSVILLEGSLSFYDERIRNLFDLKIFIDTESDLRLITKINRIMKSNPSNLKDELHNFFSYEKPVYEDFIKPTKQFTDIFLQNLDEIEEIDENDEEEENKVDNKNSVQQENKETKNTKIRAIKAICDYFNLQLEKINEGDIHYILSSINKIIDPKVKYFDNKILTLTSHKSKEFLQKLFEDFYSKKLETDFLEDIRLELIDLLVKRLIDNFKDNFYDNLDNVDLIITENDDINSIDWGRSYKMVFFYKTAILSEEDLAIPMKIVNDKKRKNTKVYVNSVFLAPKFAEILLNNNLNTLTFNSIYISDFFIKLENIIRSDETCFCSKNLSELFEETIKDKINEFKKYFL